MRTKKTLIILISGLAGAGKSTSADILRGLIDEKFPDLTTARYSLADPLKFIAQAYMGWDKEKNDAGRKLLQDLGKIGREYNDTIWVKHLLTQMDRNFGRKTQMFPTNVVIVDDWRFPNELVFLRENPMLDVVKIRLWDRGGLEGEVANDVSETSLPEISLETMESVNYYDFCVNNGADVDALKVKLDSVLLEIAKQYIVE